MKNLKMKDYVATSKNTATHGWDGSILDLLKQVNAEMINPKSKTIIPSLHDAIMQIVKGNN